jgi:hypothetical protein
MSYDQELARDPKLEARGLARLSSFVGWCKVNRVRGFLGDDPRWRKLQASFLEALDSAGMDSCAWAAGEWWNNYKLLVTSESVAR